MISTPKDTRVVIAVLDNDNDRDGDDVTLLSFSQGRQGRVAMSPDGALIYEPNPGFEGTDTFTYSVSDNNGDQAQASVNVIVGYPPVGNDDAVSILEGWAVTIDVLANDTAEDRGTLVIEDLTQPSSGLVVNNGKNVTYVSTSGHGGVDTFNYTLSDGKGLTDTATVNVEVNGVRFAVIGDFGLESDGNRDVSELVKGWAPNFIITLGDNNYYEGSAETIDRNIGQFYDEFIGSYKGSYGEGATLNRFFPTLGNHDWSPEEGPLPYLDYFTLPGNERYYEFTWGPVQLFTYDSDPRTPHGTSSISTQAQWLQERLANSTAPFKIVYFHHPPLSSLWTPLGRHHKEFDSDWPYKAWGADAVIAGHAHFYERVHRDDFPYFVNGLGGNNHFHRFRDSPEYVSEVRFNDDYGAMRVDVTEGIAVFEFVTRTGDVVDSYVIDKDPIVDVFASALPPQLENRLFAFPDGLAFHKALSGVEVHLSFGSINDYDIHKEDVIMDARLQPKGYVSRTGTYTLTTPEFQGSDRQPARAVGVYMSPCRFSVEVSTFPVDRGPQPGDPMDLYPCSVAGDGSFVVQKVETGAISISAGSNPR